MAKLYWLQPDNTIVEFPLKGEQTIIGRSGKSDVRIKHPGISSEHVLIRLLNNHASLEDLGSTNGTCVNGRRVQKHALRHGDQIEIGRERLMYFAELDNASRFAQPTPEAPFSLPGAVGETVRTDDVGSAPAAPVAFAPRNVRASTASSDISALSAQMPRPAAQLVADPVAAPTRTAVTQTPVIVAPQFVASVVMLSGAATGQRFALDKPVVSLGKAGTQVLEISLRAQGGWELSQREGSAKPYVNGDMLNAPRALSAGDVIEMVGVRMRFEVSIAANA